MSCITEGSTGYPGSNGDIPFENGMLSEMLVMAAGSMVASPAAGASWRFRLAATFLYPR